MATGWRRQKQKKPRTTRPFTRADARFPGRVAYVGRRPKMKIYARSSFVVGRQARRIFVRSNKTIRRVINARSGRVARGHARGNGGNSPVLDRLRREQSYSGFCGRPRHP